MPDREKVIKDLEAYRDRDFIREGKTVFDSDPRYRKMIINNALTLLKKQEPMEPITDKLRNYVCPVCGNKLRGGKFCMNCGQAVKLE